MEPGCAVSDGLRRPGAAAAGLRVVTTNGSRRSAFRVPLVHACPPSHADDRMRAAPHLGPSCVRRLMRRQRADRVFRMLAVALIRARLRVNHASHAPRWSGLYVSTMNSCMRSHSFSLVSDGRIGPQAAGSPHQEAHKVGRRMGAKFRRSYDPPSFRRFAWKCSVRHLAISAGVHSPLASFAFAYEMSLYPALVPSYR